MASSGIDQPTIVRMGGKGRQQDTHSLLVHNGAVTEDSVEPLAFRAVWDQYDGPTLAANYLIVQIGNPTTEHQTDDLVYLQLGHADPPILMGSDEDRRRVWERAGGIVPVQTLGRFAMTRRRAREMIRIWEDFLDSTESIATHRKEELDGGDRGGEE